MFAESFRVSNTECAGASAAHLVCVCVCVCFLCACVSGCSRRILPSSVLLHRTMEAGEAAESASRIIRSIRTSLLGGGSDAETLKVGDTRGCAPLQLTGAVQSAKLIHEDLTRSSHGRSLKSMSPVLHDSLEGITSAMCHGSSQ